MGRHGPDPGSGTETNTQGSLILRGRQPVRQFTIRCSRDNDGVGTFPGDIMEQPIQSSLIIGIDHLQRSRLERLHLAAQTFKGRDKILNLVSTPIGWIDHHHHPFPTLLQGVLRQLSQIVARCGNNRMKTPLRIELRQTRQ